MDVRGLFKRTTNVEWVPEEFGKRRKPSEIPIEASTKCKSDISLVIKAKSSNDISIQRRVNIAKKSNDEVCPLNNGESKRDKRWNDLLLDPKNNCQPTIPTLFLHRQRPILINTINIKNLHVSLHAELIIDVYLK